MGYYTHYELTITPKNEEILNAVIEKTSDCIGWSEWRYPLKSNDSYRWYEHENNMKEISKLYPDTLFMLEGEGEDPGDLWRKYFKNGKMQFCRAKITFDDFDESKIT